MSALLFTAGHLGRPSPLVIVLAVLAIALALAGSWLENAVRLRRSRDDEDAS